MPILAHGANVPSQDGQHTGSSNNCSSSRRKLMEWNQQVFGNIEAKKHSMLVMLDELDKKDGDA